MSEITEDEIQSRFADRAIRRGEERYFNLATGYEFIEACAESNLAIVGVEGFRLIRDGLCPQLDVVADFSTYQAPQWREFQSHVTTSAKAFLDAIADRSLLVNFTVLSLPEWRRK